MKGTVRRFFLGFMVCAMACSVCVVAAEAKKSVSTKKGIVATVNGEVITRDEYYRELAMLHENTHSGKAREKPERSKLLRRLIDTRLVVQEAKRMGIDQLPEVRNLIDVFDRVTLREELIERYAARIKAFDEDVDRFYKASVAEWKMSSVMFEKEKDATKMAEDLKAGTSFEELSKAAVAAGAAKRGDEGQYFKIKEIAPEITKAVSVIKPGGVTPVILLKSGYVLVKLEDIRYPDNPEEKDRARLQSLKEQQAKALKDYHSILVKKYVLIHQDAFDKVDYESNTPAFEELLKDKRVIADIKGESPITVGELSEQLKEQFYHGVNKAIESKKLNKKKQSALDEMLYKRVFRKEALALGLDRTEWHRNKVKDYENSVIFGAFVQKAVVPDVKLKEEEVKTYYETHLGEFTYPEMMRLKSLIFEKRPDAETSIEKLRKGTEFQWLQANAGGQVDQEKKTVLKIDGQMLTVDDMPEGVRKVVAGGKPGDLRFYTGTDGYFYVFSIEEVAPAKARPYEETREGIAKKIFDEKLKASLDDWIEKLRKASTIKKYLREGK